MRTPLAFPARSRPVTSSSQNASRHAWMQLRPPGSRWDFCPRCRTEIAYFRAPEPSLRSTMEERPHTT